MRALAADVDWAGFGRLARRHRVEGLVQEALARAGVVPRDAAVAQALGEAARAVAMDGLRLAVESARLQAALDGAGIPSLVLKGATLDHLAWGRIGLKRAWDIDLLVDMEDAVGARGALEAAGYRLTDPADSSPAAFVEWIKVAKEAVLHRAGDAMTVELHWRLADAARLLPGLGAASPSQTIALSPSLQLRTLARDELFAYLCVHGSSHAWSRLKWLADLAALLAREDDAGRERLYRRARALGAGACPAASLILCERLFALPLPAGAAASIRADRNAARLARLALDVLTGGAGDEAAEIDERPFTADRIVLSQLLFEDSWRYRWAEWSRQWVSIDDRMRLRLPPALAFLYGPIRAPLWLWRRLRRGFRRP